MTKSEALRLARLARTKYGRYVVNSTTDEYVCPLDLSRDRVGHHVSVWHRPGERCSAAAVDAAFVEHYLSPYDDERCSFMPAGGVTGA